MEIRRLVLSIILAVFLFSIILADIDEEMNTIKTAVPTGRQYHYISEIVVPNGIVDWAFTEHYNITFLEADTINTSLIRSEGSPLRLQTDGITRVYIDNATGNVGIGVTPAEKLDVGGDIRIRGNNIKDSAGVTRITFDTVNNNVIITIG